MQHFPIFLAVAHRRIVVSGGGEAALAKLRLLLKTEARIHVFASDPAHEIKLWAEQDKLTLTPRALMSGDCVETTIFYGANEDDTEDGRVAQIAREEGALVNVVDNLEASAFITPAIVDRDPVVVAIGTEGAAPVLARKIKADLEEQLPSTLGLLARIGKSFRSAVEILPMGIKRRNFWADYYFNHGPNIATSGHKHILSSLKSLLAKHVEDSEREGHVSFVGAGPGDPELLTLKARKAIDVADVVIYDRLVTSEILELARREALMIDVGKTGFGPATTQREINALLKQHAGSGAHVVRLKAGDPTIFARLSEETNACDDANISWNIVAGITAASAAAASIGQSLTQRERNSDVRFITGHDTKGYAAHDWNKLAQKGEVAAIYMGKKAAHYVQGRLLMHGAEPQTPVTCIENASRSNERILNSTLANFTQDLKDISLNGPVLTLYGLAAHQRVKAITPLHHYEEHVSQ